MTLIYASSILLHVERSVKMQQQQKNRKKSAIEKRSNVLIRVDKGWIGLNPIPRVQKRVESGWLLRGANRGESGWPSGSKFGLGAVGLVGFIWQDYTKHEVSGKLGFVVSNENT